MKGPRRIRVRLTLHYTAVLAVALAVYASAVYVVLRRHAYADLDHRLQEDIELAVRLAEPVPDGRLRWSYGEAFAMAEEEKDGGHWMEVWNEAAERVLHGATVEPIDLGPAPSAASAEAGARTLDVPRGRVRVLTRRGRIGGQPVLIRAAIAETPLRHRLRDLLAGLLALFPAVLAVAAFGGYAVAGRALSPVSDMAERARRITAERLSERIPVGDPGDELGQLALAFNAAFARLERSFEHLLRFTADASHELRTPLTALRSVGEVGLAPGKPPEAYRDVVASMLEETDRLTRLVDALLTLSRADAGQIPLSPETFDAGDLAREVAAQLAVLAEEREQTLLVEAPQPVLVRSDRLVLRQALMNLVDNAVKYSPRGSAIRLVAAPRDGQVAIEVYDQGPGIAPEHRERIFDRFYRVDRGRSRGQGGAGLGLALARWAVEAGGGRIEVDSAVERGSVFRIVLPRKEPDGGQVG